MSDNTAFDTIRKEVDANDVVLFMKGTPVFPQCGFSSMVVQVLGHVGVKFKGIDVLADDAVRNGIKEFSNWPTIPQLYIDGELVGGSDIVLQMAASGELSSVLGLADRPVSSVMTVRADVQWIDLARGQEDVVARLVASPHTRLLVGDGDLDSLRGVVQSRDVLADLLQGKPLQLEGNLREPQYVLSTASALQALELIRQHPVPLAVAVDEYGSVEGLVTANDLLAAIAGDLVDTQDERYGVVAQGEDQWEADGALTLDDLQRLAGVSLPRSADYMTISGLVLEQLGRLPDVGDAVEVAGVRITVLAMEKRRIARLRVERLDGMA